MLSLLYLIPVSLKPDFSFHPIISIALDALNTIFFLCGGIALAAELGVHSCGNDVRIIPYFATYYNLNSAKQNLLELHPHQPHHERLARHQGQMSRGASDNRIPLVRFRRLRWLPDPVGDWRQRRHREHARRQTRPGNEPGLRAVLTRTYATECRFAVVGQHATGKRIQPSDRRAGRYEGNFYERDMIYTFLRNGAD